MTQIQFLAAASNKGPWGTTAKREQVRGPWDFSLPKPSDNKMHRDISSKALPVPRCCTWWPHHAHSETAPRAHVLNGPALITSEGHVSSHLNYSTVTWLDPHLGFLAWGLSRKNIMLHATLGKLYAEQTSSGSAAGWHHYPHSKNRAWKCHPLSRCHSRNSAPT